MASKVAPTHWATAVGNSGAAPLPDRADKDLRTSPASARVLLWMLRAGALVSGDGGCGRISHAVILSLVHTASLCYFLMLQLRGGLSLVARGGSLVKAATETGFFGLQLFLSWCVLIYSTWARRAHFREILSASRELPHRAARLSSSHTSLQKLRKYSNWLLIYAVFITTLFGFVSFYMGFYDNDFSAPTLLPILLDVFAATGSWLFGVCSYLITFKFTLPGIYITSAFWGIAERLREAVEKKHLPSHAVLAQLRSLQDESSRAFARLVSIMSFELNFQVAYGTLNLITVLISIMHSITGGASVLRAMGISLHLINAAITILLPCELTQAALAAVSESRDLLLRPEWSTGEPQSEELSLFRETVDRDLSSLGDLGMFRLQRSTVLSIASTVLTYVIIMVQFYTSEVSINKEANSEAAIV